MFLILSKSPSDPEDRSHSFKMTIHTLTNIGWTVLNLIIKVELWRGPQRFAGLASKLLQIETEAKGMKIPTHWMFKVKSFQWAK